MILINKDMQQSKKKDINTKFKVLEEYPNCRFKKGDILVKVVNATNDVYHTDKNADFDRINIKWLRMYPHLFEEYTEKL